MTTEFDPIPECWYHHLDKGQLFFVVDRDDEKELVEIQYFDGNLEEIELPEWYAMDLEHAEQPEDWAGPLDISDTDDFGTSVTDTAPEEWDSSSNGNFGESEPPDEAAEEAEQDERTDEPAAEEPLEGHFPRT